MRQVLTQAHMYSLDLASEQKSQVSPILSWYQAWMIEV
jgi:hypothetical protein